MKKLLGKKLAGKMTDKQFVEYIKENGWIKPLNELSLRDLFILQQRVGVAIEKSVNRMENKLGEK